MAIVVSEGLTLGSTRPAYAGCRVGNGGIGTPKVSPMARYNSASRTVTLDLLDNSPR